MAFQAIPGVPEGFRGKSATQTFDPFLLPRWYGAVAQGNQIGYQSPEAYLAANPRNDATDSVTIGGTVTTGDTVELTLTNALFPGGAVSVTYTVLAADTVTTIAAALAALIANNQICRAFGISASVGGTNDAVITVAHNGPVGNFTVGTSTLSGGATETATWANSGAFSGGSGPVVPLATFSAFPEVAGATRTMQFIYGRPVTIDRSVLSTLNAAGLPLG